MTTPAPSPSQNQSGPLGLSDLKRLPLDAENQRALDQRLNDMLGSRAWCLRKRAEAHGLMALSQIAPRLIIRHLDLRTDIVALLELRDTPVPCMSPGAPDIHIVYGALTAIEYPADILIKPLPGTRPVRLIQPTNAWHSNIGPPDVQPAAICLGHNVPRGLPLTEMVLLSYAALTLQAVSLDYQDSAGVLNPEAAIWWQSNAHRAPLTTASFLDPLRAGTPQADPTASNGARSGEDRS
jgi:hypothetical protein